MSKLLVFFTSSYPNSSGEVFVENEIRFLENAFDKIIIICTAQKSTNQQRYLPKNAVVVFFNDSMNRWKKVALFGFVLKGVFWNEIYYAHKILHIKFRPIHIKILLMDLLKASMLRQFTNKLLKEQSTFNQTHLYSYWSDYKAITCALLKIEHPEFKAYARNHRWDLYFHANNPQYLPLRKFIFDQLDAAFCISEDGANYLKRNLKLTRPNIKVARLGTINKQSELKPYQKNTPFLLVSCSNIIPVKRIHLLIEALSLINDQRIHWVHFGDGGLKAKLINLAKNQLVQNNIIFEFKGAMPNEQIMSFYRNHQVDLFINVSESEGVPVSIMEAMSFGIPVIATAVGGTTEIVKDNYNGYLISPSPIPKEITEMITRFCGLPDNEKNDLRKGAFKTWANAYNAENNYPQFIEIISGL